MISCIKLKSSDKNAASEKFVKIENEGPGIVIGGLGVINENLYINTVVKKNELMFHNGNIRTWTGLNREIKQVVFVFNNAVIEDAKFPPDFKISKCVVVSFEVDKVYFFDFARGDGGYYFRSIDGRIPDDLHN